MINSKNNPRISVVMSVYKEPVEWIKEAANSILRQTFYDFEFLIVLDCPEYTGNVAVYNMAKQDERIKVIKNETNQGLTKSLIHAIALAKGEYIARMDADDIAECNRFEKQYQYMEQFSSISVVGSYIDVFREDGSHCIGMNNLDSDKERNRIKMLFCNAGVAHSTAFIRKSFLDRNSISYDSKMKKSQDYGLWTDIVMNDGEIQVIPEVLVRYRVHSNQITNKSQNEQRECYRYAIRKQLEMLEISPSEEELSIHNNLFNNTEIFPCELYDEYLSRLLAANQAKAVYDNRQFKLIVMSLYGKIILKSLLKKRFNMVKSKYLFEIFTPAIFKEMVVSRMSDKSYNSILRAYLNQKSVN